MWANMASIKTSSNGAWQGENPLNYAVPLLILQTILILAVTRLLAFLLKPLRQPKVVAEIIGGILLGPSALGRNKNFLHLIFPSWSTPILESVASIGLLFFLFLVGLELDLSSFRKSARRALTIGLAGICLPFVFGVGVTFLIRKSVEGADKISYSHSLMFIGVALSITAFPVLARILAELKLLTTQVGETAMAAAAFNDVAAWILLTLVVALAGNNGGVHKSPLTSVWILISGVAFVTFMLFVTRPAMNWVARRCSPEPNVDVHEAYICLTLAGVLISGFLTDLIGIHAIFGAFVFGLTIPKRGEFSGRLLKRIEDFVSGLLLPLYFASSGLKTDLAKMRGAEAWGLLVVVISTACAGKILGTFVVAMMCMIPARESLALGVLMNTKGLVELVVLNIGKEKKVLNDEMFTILVLMAVVTTFMTTPTVMAIYRPARTIASRRHRQLQPRLSLTQTSQDGLRLLACVHGPGNLPSLLNLIHSTRPAPQLPFKLYVMRLVELTDRSSSIMMVKRARKNGFPFINRFRRSEWHDQVEAAFEAYRLRGRVDVRPTTAISVLSTMHEDICYVAEQKKVSMIILPFHKQWRGEEDEAVENVGYGWRGVNQRVLDHAPCTVAMIVDRGLCGVLGRRAEGTEVAKRACVVFLGGADDREALEFGGSIAANPGVKVSVVRFVVEDGMKSDAAMMRPCPSKSTEYSHSFTTPCKMVDPQKEMELDEAAIAEFKRRWEGSAEYVEKGISSIVEDVFTIGQSGEFELVVVGMGRFPPDVVAELAAERTAEHPELGVVGDMLASAGRGIVSSVLVIQHRHVEKAPASKMVCGEDGTAIEESSV